MWSLSSFVCGFQGQTKVAGLVARTFACCAISLAQGKIFAKNYTDV